MGEPLSLGFCTIPEQNIHSVTLIIGFCSVIFNRTFQKLGHSVVSTRSSEDECTTIIPIDGAHVRDIVYLGVNFPGAKFARAQFAGANLPPKITRGPS